LIVGDPGTIAYVALILWAPVCIAAFFIMRPERALLFGVLGALLFLPEVVQFKLPLMPPLNKQNIPYVCAFIGCLFRVPRRVLRLPKERWFTWLTVALILGSVGTALTNGDSLRYGSVRTIFIPGLTVKDGLYTGIDQMIHAALPFFLGLSLFRTSKDLRDLLAGIAIAGLVYVPFTAIEMRMSPQFHYWIYGYHQHSFLQTMRWGGYRPMVFMSHGLALARFFVVATLSALLVSAKRRTLLGIPSRVATAILFVTLVLCKSTGALVFGVLGLAGTFLGRARLRQTLAVVFAAAVLLYPALRAADLIPVSRIVSAADVAGSERQQSLGFRFENEDTLLAKARQRIIFGWGEYNRSATFNDMGQTDSVTDGHWIILFGVLGVVGFISCFGMLLIPIFLTRRRLRGIPDKSEKMLVSGVSLMIGLVALDLIPNGLWADYPYLMAGALMGVTRGMVIAAKQRPRETALVKVTPTTEAAAAM
jgi:hypothetical protein